jgi:hypothetical protein
VAVREEIPMITLAKRVFDAYVRAAGNYPTPMLWAF